MPLTHLTLLVPELLWPEPEDHDVFKGLDCPALTILLARSRLDRRPPQSLEATLADLFGHAEGAPYGVLRKLGESAGSVGMEVNVEKDCWIAADPVHLRFHQERLILADGATLKITQEEAEVLAEDMNRHFVDIGRVHVAAPERWYLQLTEKTTLGDFSAPPLSTVAGRSVDRLLPEIMQDREIRKLLNEIQTFLHAHPVNQRRESSGLLPLNSVWLWGAGRQPQRIESDFDGVWSINPLATGLARAAGVPTHPLPINAAALFDHAAPDTRQLVVLEDLAGPVQYENGEAYRNAITALEHHWFAPLQKALASGKLKQLRIEATTAYATLSWESTRRDQWHFWRRPHALAEIAKTLAKDTQ